MDEVQDTGASVDDVAVQPVSSESNTISEQTPSEKMIPQSEVNRIVGKTRQDVSEKAYARAKSEFEAARSAQDAPTTNGLCGIKGMDEDQIRQLIQDEGQKQAQLAQAQKIAIDFTNKMKAGSQKYQDFDEIVSELNLPNVPHIVNWANSLDNTADIMYDLAKNPAKFANVLMLSQTTPHIAQRELKRLSDSIKKNADAADAPRANQPLDHLKPSNTGMDNGAFSVSDYQKMDWLRG